MNTKFIRKCYDFINLVTFYLDKINYGHNAALKKLKELNIPYEAISVNSDLKDIHKGKRCFVVGNAPSINKQDLSLLADEYVFTVNYIYKNPRFSQLKSNYHFFMDPMCFNKETNGKETFTAVATEHSKPLCFLSANGGYHYVKDTGLDRDLDIRYLFDFVNMKKQPVAGDISKEITGFYTVIQTAVLTAVYMGFSEIYLIGCDCTGIVSNIQIMENSDNVQGYSYEFTKEDREKRLKEYQGHVDMEQIFSGWANILHGYPRLNTYCKEHGVKLYNATAGGILESLPRVKYEDLFSK